MNRIFILFTLVLILSCDKNTSNRNPYLQEISFQFSVNLNLPLYSPLTNTGNAVFIGNKSVGTRGIFIMNSGFNQFRAFEASCPNHAPSSCSTMELNGTSAICSCEEYEYSLFTGQLVNAPKEGKFYNMLEYRTSFSGTVITISN
ncbi:MAG: hypothetical protein V3U92_08160 [Cellulophaga sp.]